jgi:hypothetical protein
MTLRALLFFLLLLVVSTTKGQLNYNNPKDTTIVLLFKSGKYDLDEISRRNVEACYNKLITRDQAFFYIINISGYSDDKGKDSANYILSKKRAMEVGKYLISLSNDTMIRKKGTYDYMTQCEGVGYQTEEYIVPIQYEYFGEQELKYKKIDSINFSKERKALLRFTDKREFCLGTFGVCSLPSSEQVFRRDSTIQVVMPAGYIDQYTVGHALPPCRYNESTQLTVKFIDSLPTQDNLCERIISSFRTKQKKAEIKIGSLSILAFLNDTAVIVPVCKDNYYKENKIKIRFSLKLIPAKDFILYTSKHELIDYQIKDGYVEAYINLGASQTIDVFIKNSSFKNSKLIIKGKTNFSVSVTEPINKCEIPLEAKESKRGLFSKRTVYTLVKFSKAENRISLLNPDTNQIISVNLKALKYRKSKDTYVLNRRAIKRLMTMQ